MNVRLNYQRINYWRQALRDSPRELGPCGRPAAHDRGPQQGWPAAIDALPKAPPPHRR